MRDTPHAVRIAIANLYLRYRAARHYRAQNTADEARSAYLAAEQEAWNALAGTIEAIRTQSLPFPPRAGIALARKLQARRPDPRIQMEA